MNAANELAVAAFLDRKIRYDQIHAVNEETLSTFVPDIPGSLADLLELDQESRRAADKIIQRLKY
jgi:1-deoxy-D-xylulose-5-phosphate reductoisomerase